MLLPRLLLSACIGLALLPSWAAAETASPEPTTGEKVTITWDYEQAPELADWAKQAGEHCGKWYPLICDYLQTEGYRPPTTIRVVFRSRMRGIAYTNGTTITISAAWVKAHPDDFGMVIHELTHVVQSYPRYEPSWLVEGVADYVRYWQFEPEAPRPSIHARAGLRSGYGPTAAFLHWLVESKDEEIVKKLNVALRRGTCQESIFEELLGENVDELWKQFLAEQAAA